MAELSYRKRNRADSVELDYNSAEFEFDYDSKRIREDLLSLLDDSDTFPDDHDSSPGGQQDLDSVIRSFEEEISGSRAPTNPPEIVDLTSDSGDSLQELGQLLGTSEEEDARPVGTELVRVESESSGIGEFWDFQDEFPSYDSFGFGAGYAEFNNNGNLGQGENDEYVTLDGIFDYSDLSWRPGSLPAM